MRADNPLKADLESVLGMTMPIWKELDGKSVFITGATGFFGSWLIESAAFAIDQLGLSTKVGWLARKPPAKDSNLVELISHPSFQFVQGDVRTFEYPAGEWSHIIHAAAAADPVAQKADPTATLLTNVDGTRHCLDFAKTAYTDKLLFVSSGAVYGKLLQSDGLIYEEAPLKPLSDAPDNAYALGKRAAERLVHLSVTEGGICAGVARCFTFVGPYQDINASFAITSFIRDCLHDRPIIVGGDGSPLRSYMYATDLAAHLWTMLVKAPSTEVINIGSDEGIDIASVAHTVNRVLNGRGVSVLGSRNPDAPVSSYVPNVRKSRKILGLECTTNLEDAILKTANWYRKRSIAC